MNWRRHVPGKEALLESRWLKPFAHHLAHDDLWRMTREGVARGVGIGFFFGLLLPVLQVLFSSLAAVYLRANLGITVASTFISNPFTFAPIYWLAYELGAWILDGKVNHYQAHQVAEQAAAASGWFTNILTNIQSAGMPLVLGLVVLACTVAPLAYLTVRLLWRPRG
jgi:uncharacterized protein